MESFVYCFNGKNSMKNKYILKLFIAFLKRKGVYDVYLYALYKGEHYRFNYNRNWIIPEKFIIETIQRSPSNLISDAFDWSNCEYSTYKKWLILNDEWENLMYDKFGF
jgi:hypothetical protein